MSAPPPDERFFRHAYGRLVATLTSRLGPRHLAAAEDAAQAALLAALETWTAGGVPDDPPAWLFRAAMNHALGELRQEARRGRIAALGSDLLAPGPAGEPGSDVDLLAMLVACCDAAIPVESQPVLALRVLCGFDVREIAARLWATEATVYKRLERARARLRALPGFPALAAGSLQTRLPAVHATLYLLFTEGHLSLHPEAAIRRELCEEAIRLARILAGHPEGATPETHALLALMCLHLARVASRQDAAGGLLLLEEQPRSRWDQALIREGLAWLARSAQGEAFSRYHAEAGVAAEHCLAPSLGETRWERVVACYELLERDGPSPIHTLNRALAVAEWKGPTAGLAVLEGLAPPSWLAGSHLWSAVLADLHRRCGNVDEAARHREAALVAAPTPAVRELLRRRLGS